MYQLGSKHVKLGLTQLKMIVAETVTCSLAVYSEDFQPDAWKNLVQAPAKVILNRLGELQPLITSVWGRSFRKDKDRSAPVDSTTVQVWVSLPTSATNDLLRLSGFSSVYVTPRSATGGIDTSYPVFWMTDSTRVSMETTCAGLPHLGFIRGGGNKPNYAIRSTAATAQAIHDKVRPGESWREPVAVTELFKLTHLPPGITRDALTELGTEMKWALRPIKRLNHRTWLVGAGSAPSSWCVQLGGASILITRVEPKQLATAAVVLAGRTPETRSSSSTADPWLINDPWAAAAPKSTLPPARVTQGPIQTKHEEQDKRLDSLEQKIQVLTEGQQHIEKSQHEMQAAITSQLQGIASSVTTQLESSMQQAISRALKTRPTIRDSPEKAAPLKKAQRIGSDDDM